MESQAFSDLYLENMWKLFGFYKTLGEKTIAQLKDEHINKRANDDSNSIALIVKHLSGNMLSRWTDFLTSDGEKPWRRRDDEFEGEIPTIAELMTVWNTGWDCLLKTLKQLKPEDLEKTVYIRNEAQTVIEAISRQLAHYSYHVGQIIYMAKEIKGSDWVSLSIPKKKA